MDEKYFTTLLLNEAIEFLSGLSPNLRKKIYRRIVRAETMKDPAVFKKLRNDIWEFRFRYGFTQIRLLAFWDKTDNDITLVLATHGFLKKTDKVPGKEIERAINIRKNYFESKKQSNG